MQAAFKGYQRSDIVDAELNRFTIVLKDTSDFGHVGLQGIHHELDTDGDVHEILYSVDRDGFDRVFVYIKGLDDCSFDVGETRDLLTQLESAGGTLALGTHNAAFDRWQTVSRALTMKQYHAVQTHNYKSYFERVLKVSKRPAIRQAATEGLKYCALFGWSALT